jgi:hypothetical protein
MVVFRDLRSVLETAIGWEERLSAFFGVATMELTDEECIQDIAVLRDRHEQCLAIVRSVRVENFGRDEWIRFAEDPDIRDTLPNADDLGIMTRGNIAAQVLEYETGLRDFYRAVSEEIVTSEGKDLFESLACLKDKQILDIRRCFDIR